MERKSNQNLTNSIVAEGWVYEGQSHSGEESPYLRFLSGEDVPPEILEEDPVYRLMRRTPLDNLQTTEERRESNNERAI